MKNEIKRIFDELNEEQRKDHKASCIEDIVLADYMEGRLNPDETKKVRAHIEICNFCLSALAYYYKSNKEMAEAFKSKEAAENGITKETPQTLWDRIKSVIENFNTPYHPLPVYALCLLVVVSLISVNVFKQPSSRIILIEGSEYLTIQKKAVETPSPSLAFMGDESEKTTEKFKGMEITAGNGKIIFKWPSVNEAAGYNFTLKEITGKKTEKDIYSSSTKETGIEVFEKTVKRNRKYRWELSGSLKNDRIFKAEGEFVR